MGTFHVDIQVAAPGSQRFDQFDALVDSGATYLTVPRSRLRALGVLVLERSLFTLADGTSAEYEIGAVSLRLQGRTLPTLCVFGDDESDALLGAVALEDFRLMPDPINKRLVPVQGLLVSVWVSGG